MTPIQPGDVLSYPEMCQAEGVSLQAGMNFRIRNGRTVVLMSRRRGAPYADRVEDQGRTLIYEGHDEPRRRGSPDPKTVDQPSSLPSGSPNQNGRFITAAEGARSGKQEPELVRVYEKLRTGIWVFNGVFRLTDTWEERANGRRVFKFRLELTADSVAQPQASDPELTHTRLIPTDVKLDVWKRDGGRCRMCGSTDNLHFDHIIPFSKGGSSLTSENIQLLCARHNIAARDAIH